MNKNLIVRKDTNSILKKTKFLRELSANILLDESNDTIDDKLKKNLLSTETQSMMYTKVNRLKYYGDLISISQSEELITAYQKAVMDAFESAVEIYEWLQEKNILELNALTILGSFYIFNLSDHNSTEANKFSDEKITNMIDSFLWGMGAYGKVNTSTYNDLVRTGINWLSEHPKD